MVLRSPFGYSFIIAKTLRGVVNSLDGIFEIYLKPEISGLSPKNELLFAIFPGFWYTEMDKSRREGNGMKEFTQKHQRVLDYIRQ